jgi:hypothetical protein
VTISAGDALLCMCPFGVELEIRMLNLDQGQRRLATEGIQEGIQVRRSGAWPARGLEPTDTT